MQMVIKIPEEEYKRWRDEGEMDAVILRDALVKGTPLLKGHWIKIHKEDPNSIWYRCSSCDRYFDIPYQNQYPFCPMCGAKMSETPTGAESEE